MKYYIKIYLKSGDKISSHDMDYLEMRKNKEQLQKDNIEFEIFNNKGYIND